MKDLSEITFNIGGLKVRFAYHNTGRELISAAKFQNYVWDGLADVNFEIHPLGFSSIPSLSSGLPNFSAADWALSYVDRQILLNLGPFSDPSLHPIQVALIYPDGLGGELWVAQETPENPTLLVPPVLLDELLEVYLLARGWGVMLHACGVKTDLHQGLIFSGVSRAGKSTSARLWSNVPGAGLLSDERIVVRKQDEKFWIFGTPWHSDGPPSQMGCAPLDHLFIIHHAPENQARRLDPDEALAQLMPQVFLPYGDPDGLTFTLDFLGELVQRVPCFNLGFVPDQSAVAFVQSFVHP